MTVYVKDNGIQHNDGTLQSTAGGVKSVQTGFVYLNTNGSGEDSRYVDTVINYVDVTKSYVYVQRRMDRYDGDYSLLRRPTARLINNTIVRVSHGWSGIGAYARYFVIEFY